MWKTPKPLTLPKTRGVFYLACEREKLFYIKPGKVLVRTDKRWDVLQCTGNLYKRIDRVTLSQCGQTVIHVPKASPLIAVHQNTPSAILLTLPIPTSTPSGPHISYGKSAIVPSGEGILVTPPLARVSDVPYIFDLQAKPRSNLLQHIRGISASESGDIIALALDDQFWVWQQIRECSKGLGYWADLTSDSRFGMNVFSNHPYTQEGRVYHGYLKPRQTFTLYPALAPNIPQNSAISYQDLSLFDNPDEGRGVCCLTLLLPPCRPYDTVYLYNAVCHFKGYQPYFQRYETSFSITPGAAGPCIWWSPCCRIAVVAVFQTLLLLTRSLQLIKKIPISEILPGDDPIVSSIAWSCSGQFFLVTSTDGTISAISRSGESLKHKLCSLSKFNSSSKTGLLLAASDSYDPSLFVIYTTNQMRILYFDTTTVPQTLSNLMSIHFPYKSTVPYIDEALETIAETARGDIKAVISLLKLTNLFQIFEYQSPLRYLIFSVVDRCITNLLRNNQHLMAFLMLRCFFRVSDLPATVYQEVIDRLSASDRLRDRFLCKIIDDELKRTDFVIDKNPIPIRMTRIVMYENYQPKAKSAYIKPDPHFHVDIFSLVEIIKILLYTDDSIEIPHFLVDFLPLLDILILLGRYDLALLLFHHHSISYDPSQFFHRVKKLFPEDALRQHAAFQICLQIPDVDEASLRADALSSLLSLLKQKILNSMPANSGNSKMKLLSALCSIEEGLEIIIPKNQSECNDFSIILGIAFSTAGYRNLAYYMNGRMQMIPEELGNNIRELFGLIWFIRWRYHTILETARTGHANDATLRLLLFPEFVNIRAASAQCKAAGASSYSPSALAFYGPLIRSQTNQEFFGPNNSNNINNINNRDISKFNMKSNRTSIPITNIDVNLALGIKFENDPAYPDFMGECGSRITSREILRLEGALDQIEADLKQQAPRSNLLIATITSHLVPWLRCAILRAIAGIPEKKLPTELTDLEDLILPPRPPPNMVLKPIPAVTVPPKDYVPPEPHHEEEEEEKPVKEDFEDDGEFIMPEPIEPKKITPKKRPKKKSKKHVRPVIPEPEPEPPKKKDDLHLLSIDSNPTPTGYIPMQYCCYPSYGYTPNYAVWDFDGHFGKKPDIPKEKPPPEPPVKEVPKEQKPFIIMVNKEDSSEARMNESTSSISDVEDDGLKPVNFPPIDSFPLDEELQKRVADLLNDRKFPDELPKVPTFQAPVRRKFLKPEKPQPKETTKTDIIYFETKNVEHKEEKGTERFYPNLQKIGQYDYVATDAMRLDNPNLKPDEMVIREIKNKSELDEMRMVGENAGFERIESYQNSSSPQNLNNSKNRNQIPKSSYITKKTVQKSKVETKIYSNRPK